MTKRCPYCGVELQKTNLGRYFCMNCGIVDKEDDGYEPKGESDSYIG